MLIMRRVLIIYAIFTSVGILILVAGVLSFKQANVECSSLSDSYFSEQRRDALVISFKRFIGLERKKYFEALSEKYPSLVRLDGDTFYVDKIIFKFQDSRMLSVEEVGEEQYWEIIDFVLQNRVK